MPDRADVTLGLEDGELAFGIAAGPPAGQEEPEEAQEAVQAS